MRIGFLFNHYLTYQILHGAPIAFELSRLREDLVIDLLFSTREYYEEAIRISSVYPGHKCNFLLLEKSGISDFVPKRFPALDRPLVLAANRKLLASYDALVAPEKNYIQLKALPSFRKTKFIGMRHGAGDRPGSLNKGILKFDFLMVPGQSYYERFKNELPEGCCEVIGYPKFEVLEKLNPTVPQLFDNERPTIVYVPHFHRKQSSWISMGAQILSFFKNSKKYNVIFAPHARLFKHIRNHDNIKLDEFENIPNILIDTGSGRSFDMTYTRAADIYLGDVSSQVYEFVHHKRRPCVFLNAHNMDQLKMNFWQLGPVIDKVGMLEHAISNAEQNLEEQYRAKQDFFVNAAFTDDGRLPSQKGADAIVRFLQC